MIGQGRKGEIMRICGDCLKEASSPCDRAGSTETRALPAKIASKGITVLVSPNEVSFPSLLSANPL